MGKVKTHTKHQKIYEWLIEQIRKKIFIVGDQLPTQAIGNWMVCGYVNAGDSRVDKA